MDFAAFKTSLNRASPPAELSSALQGLWWDAKGDWDKAHDCAKADEGGIGDWVHAYLHRKEGDKDNAGYWYRRVDKPFCDKPLLEEWADIAQSLLALR
jgi:hypothetical protein